MTSARPPSCTPQAAGSCRRTRAPNIAAATCAAAVAAVDLGVVDGLGAEFLGESETFRYAVDRDDPARTVEQRTARGHQPDGSGAPHRDRVAAGDIAEVGLHVPRRYRVGHEQGLLVGDEIRYREAVHIAERSKSKWRELKDRRPGQNLGGAAAAQGMPDDTSSVCPAAGRVVRDRWD
jgi:hypothetical protein